MTGKRRQRWQSNPGVADKISVVNLFGWDISTGDMNDFVSASKIDDTVIDFGTGNDLLNVIAIGNVTVDGGAGNDTISFLGYQQSAFDFVYNEGSEWTFRLLSAYDQGAVVRNVETIQFKDGIIAKLKAADATPASITFSGTKNGETFWLPINSAYSPDVLPAATIINAGAGNDTIIVPMSGSGLPARNFIDGGAGTDTLFFWGLPQMYSFEKSARGWKVLDFNGQLLIDTISIERATFSDGATIKFVNDGIELTGGTRGLQVSGTAGDDTMKGTTEADIFWTTAGTDTYDLSQGGRDTIFFDPGAYAPGTTTNMTVKGFTRNDRIMFYLQSSGHIIVDETKYANGVRTGNMLISWDKYDTVLTSVSFTA